MCNRSTLWIGKRTLSAVSGQRRLHGTLVFSSLGDVFLLSDAELFFMLGLGSLFIAHILYCWIFTSAIRREFTFKVNLWVLVVILTYLVVFLGYLWSSLGDLLIPVVAYALIISTMLFLAWSWYLSTRIKSTLIIFIGAILFVLSDSLLAISLFRSSFYMDHFWVMFTYLSAQSLLIYGLWRRYRLTWCFLVEVFLFLLFLRFSSWQYCCL